MTTPLEHRLLLAGTWLVAALFAFLPLSKMSPTQPDLAQFYFAGELVLNGQAAELYDPSAYTVLVERLRSTGTPVSEMHFFNRPAFAALPWATAAALPYQTAAKLFLYLNVMAIGLLTWKLPVWFPGLVNYRAWLICFPPFLWALSFGQDVILITLALAYGMVLMRAGKETRAGLLLSLCVVKPQLVWLVPAALFFSGKKSTAVWFVIGGLAWATVSLLLVGPAGLKQWAELLSAGTTDYGPETMATLRAIGLRTNVWAGGLAAAVTAAALAFACRSGDWQRALPASIAASMILSPHAYVQDAAIFSVAAGFAASTLLRSWLLLPWPVLAVLLGVEDFLVAYAVVGAVAVIAFAAPFRLPAFARTADLE